MRSWIAVSWLFLGTSALIENRLALVMAHWGFAESESRRDELCRP